MYIGGVSKLTGASPKAIRLYETLGLIPKPERKGAYRNFQVTDIEKILIIRKAQKFGFTLSYIKKMIDKETSCENFPWATAIFHVKEKIKTVQIDIDRLQKQKEDLIEFASLLEAGNCK